MKGNQGGVEILEIKVDKALEDNRCDCWRYNVEEQFPLKNINKNNEKCIVEVGPPHEGYSIETTIENWKMNGESKILSKDNIVIATLTYVNGVATGPCKLYDESGILFFEGYLENGYRQGSGKEYDEKGYVVFEGFYDKGKKLNIVRMKEKRGYWKEYDEKGKLMSISKRDSLGRKTGICYFYDDKCHISRISKWENGEEIGDCGYCEIFDENSRIWYKGYFENGIQDGYGKEYDEKGYVVFEGFYDKGKKLNIVRMKEKRGYWKEYDEKGKLMSISERDIFGRKTGICYFYDDKCHISKISTWVNGEEISILKQFSGNIMIEYIDGIRRYEGCFRDSFRDNYPYQGQGKEYAEDGVTLVYKGYFRNGKRHGKGISYKNMRVNYNGYWSKGCQIRWLILLVCILFLLFCPIGIYSIIVAYFFIYCLIVCYC